MTAATPMLALLDRLTRIHGELTEIGLTLRQVSGRCADSAEIADIQNEVALEWGLTREQIVGHCRQQRLVVPRHVAMWIAARITPRAIKEIAYDFRRDPTSVCHAIRLVEARLMHDKALAHRVTVLLQRLDRKPTP